MTLRKIGSFPFIPVKKLRRALVICHRHADVDAYCSAYGVRYLLKQLNPQVKVSIACPEGLGVPAKKIAEIFPMPTTLKPEAYDTDLVVIVDTGHAELLTGWLGMVKASPGVKVAIDHHPLDSSMSDIVDYALVDEKASSACEIVYRLLKAKKTAFTGKVSRALLAGILYDSQHLRLARVSTLRAVLDLCGDRDLLEPVKQLLRIPRDRSEVVARLKGAQRLGIYDAEGWLIALSHIGSFHASLARALISLGADLALVTDGKKNESRATLRSSELFNQETGIHLGLDIARPISKALGGIGGGHPTAATLTSNTPENILAEKVMQVVSEKMGVEIRLVT